MFDNSLSITLGEDQIKWKNRYGKIDLSQWRFETFSGDKSEWVYVGNWLPDNSKSRESYLERKENLLINKYYYWPKDKIE
jgi:hypothetical protein